MEIESGVGWVWDSVDDYVKMSSVHVSFIILDQSTFVDTAFILCNLLKTDVVLIFERVLYYFIVSK